MDNMLPLPPSLPHFDHRLRIRGVEVALRVFPTVSQFIFNTDKKISPVEKEYLAHYMQFEGFLDNPVTGEMADIINL